VVNILYGVNKYANDNGFDIVFHIHFNDYPGRRGSWGKYSGFSIYVPERQYSNADASYDLAEKINDQLSQSFASSNMPKEGAIVEDQELIAIGANNTADPVSALVEYGYIYEDHFTNKKVSDVVLEELAYQTYKGIMNYISDDDIVAETYSRIGSRNWFYKNLSMGDKGVSTLALQDYLSDKGYYPPNDNLNKCPLTGFFGDCTQDALRMYQRDNDLNASGYLDTKTQELIEGDVR